MANQVRVALLLSMVMAWSTLFLLRPVEAQNKGRVYVAPCPHSCATRGIEKRVCRDWREGSTCYVEDLRFPPSMVVVAPPTPFPPHFPPGVVQPRPSDTPANTLHPSHGANTDEIECRNLARGYLARPRVNIHRVRPTGNLFGDRVRVEGSVEGVCLVEAGLFESGRKEQSIRIVTSPMFRRYDFSVRTRIAHRPEIRVYNVVGDRDEVWVRTDD